MPKIERDIPYTFSAYSGGSLRPLAAATEQRARLASAAEEEGKGERAGGKEEGDDDDKRGDKGGFKDVYTFDEEEDELNYRKEPVSSMPRPKSAPEASIKSAASPLSPSGPSPSKAESSETPDGQSSGSEAGLLVMAALTAAENDIMGDKGDAPDRSKGEGARGGGEGVEKCGKKKKDSSGETDGAQESSHAVPRTPSQAPLHLTHSARSLLSKRPRTPQRDLRKKEDSALSGTGELVDDSPRPQLRAAAAPGSALSVKGPLPTSLPPPPPPPNPNPYLSTFPSEPFPLYPTALDIAATNYHAPGPYHHQHPQHLSLRPRGGYSQYPHHQVGTHPNKNM